MRIQHNIAALNAHRYLSSNNDAVAKNLEKLSSGYKINRAGDDAAGLSISEKMRAQIKGLETATKNAQDGVSMVQTAEGNLTEVHSMLNRMVELSTQAANGTYQDLNREEIQKEVNSLTSEIDRISSSANFNGIKLLDGSLGAAKNPTLDAATINGTTATLSPVAAKGSTFTTDAIVKATDTTTNQTLTISYKDANGKATSVDVSYKGGTDATTTATNILNAINADPTAKGLFKASADSGKLKLESVSTGSNAIQATGITSTDAAQKKLGGGPAVAGTDATSSVDLSNWKAGDSVTLNGKVYQADTVNALDELLKKDGFMHSGSTTATTFIADPAAEKGLILQIGESNDSYQQVRVSIGNMDSKSLGLGGIDLSSQIGALAAMDTVSRAIDQVSATRGSLGAIQNRLDHTINNLSVTDENMAAAESRIRDVDMAKEMMDFTKNNILTQAAQSMLAQANTLPQGVLQLLR